LRGAAKSAGRLVPWRFAGVGSKGAPQRDCLPVPSALLLVEGEHGGLGEGYQAGVSTASRFVHANVTPGVPMRYRVTAQRGSHNSGVSNKAGVYGA
jgi:hypothetical protein